MLFLGFSAGLPFYLVFQTLSAWLRQDGIERATIGMLAWVGLVYTVKFLWSPIVDRARIPLLFAWLGQAAQLDAAGADSASRSGSSISPPAIRPTGVTQIAVGRPVSRVLFGNPGHRDRCVAHRIGAGGHAGRDGRGVPDRLSRRPDHGRRRRARHRRRATAGRPSYTVMAAAGRRRHRHDAAGARADGARLARVRGARGARRRMAGAQGALAGVAA